MSRGISWDRELTRVLNEDVHGGRMTGAVQAEESLQLDETLFRKSDHGANMLGEGHFRSADLSGFDSFDGFEFGDNPQEKDEEEEAAEEAAMANSDIKSGIANNGKDGKVRKNDSAKVQMGKKSTKPIVSV